MSKSGMFVPHAIFEKKKVIDFLEQRNLLFQYKKAKDYILSGHGQQTDFKIRQPKKDEMWYFRINKQYRAVGYVDDRDLIIIKIDDHQY